jgi:hypothetical protein
MTEQTELSALDRRHQQLESRALDGRMLELATKLPTADLGHSDPAHAAAARQAIESQLSGLKPHERESFNRVVAAELAAGRRAPPTERPANWDRFSPSEKRAYQLQQSGRR